MSKETDLSEILNVIDMAIVPGRRTNEEAAEFLEDINEAIEERLDKLSNVKPGSTED
jgi:hypothetical protein